MQPDSKITHHAGWENGQSPSSLAFVQSNHENLYLCQSCLSNSTEKLCEVEMTSKTVSCDKTRSVISLAWIYRDTCESNQTPQTSLSFLHQQRLFHFIRQLNVQLKVGIKGQSVCPEGWPQCLRHLKILLDHQYCASPWHDTILFHSTGSFGTLSTQCVEAAYPIVIWPDCTGLI